MEVNRILYYICNSGNDIVHQSNAPIEEMLNSYCMHVSHLILLKENEIYHKNSHFLKLTLDRKSTRLNSSHRL